MHTHPLAPRVSAPTTRGRDTAAAPCCRACARGTRALPGPCAAPATCACHKAERLAALRAMTTKEFS